MLKQAVNAFIFVRIFHRTDSHLRNLIGGLAPTLNWISLKKNSVFSKIEKAHNEKVSNTSTKKKKTFILFKKRFCKFLKILFMRIFLRNIIFWQVSQIGKKI